MPRAVVRKSSFVLRVFGAVAVDFVAIGTVPLMLVILLCVMFL